MLDAPISNDRCGSARLGIKVISSTVSISSWNGSKAGGRAEGVGACLSVMPTTCDKPHRRSFLRIPPFPGARISEFATVDHASDHLGRLPELIRRHRIGGTFWGEQPDLPPGSVSVRSVDALEAAKKLAGAQPIVLWQSSSSPARPSDGLIIVPDADPWHVLSSASAVLLDGDDELRLIAALLNVPVYDFDRSSGTAVPAKLDIDELIREQFAGKEFEDPFTGEPMTPFEAVELCGFWRRLIDSNRDLAFGIGFAFWKQAHIAPLLWGGSSELPFRRSGSGPGSAGNVAIWRSKVSNEELRQFECNRTPLIEVEDGFLRSRGLGADCIPPLSITVDRLGAFFDPSKPSELEQLLEKGEFDDFTLERANEIRQLIVDAGLGKYEQGNEPLERPAGARRHILLPGQVEDDRSVETGGCGLVSNLELLKRVREQAPEAYILYKPHPDVLAGHRRGGVPERLCLEHADQVVGALPASSLIEMVDEVHVNTSLTGFEALLRLKPVTTYGVPFYAGWGLTRDLGPVPSRRTRKCTIDELVAAALLIYPRYLDPVTGLPCPAEVVVARLGMAAEAEPTLLVAMRRLQGKFMRRLRSLVL